MRTVRVIPCLDVDAGRVVKGVQFIDLFDAGDPVELATRYDAQGADELVFLDILLRPHAATGLHRNVDGGGNVQHLRTVDRSPLPCGVEVDHVQPGRAGHGETTGQGHRVAVPALAIEVALGQPDRSAVPDVNGR